MTLQSVAVPGTGRPAEAARSRPRRQPRYHVILWDDDHHTYEYVIYMMRGLFGLNSQSSYAVASDVDHQGRAVCLTTTREHAELKRDQIHAYGKDARLGSSQGSMSSTIEPES